MLYNKIFKYIMYNKYNNDLILEIISKIDDGQKCLKLEKEYNISRGTIRYWYNNKENYYNSETISILDIEPKSYSYILGLYLGDGYINKMKRTYKLRITLDVNQDLVIDECIKHLKILFPKNKINPVKRKNKNCLDVIVYSNKLNIYFPQLGNGMKHQRKIELTKEQIEIIDTKFLMKGLFHSDGSFYIAGNKYPRYNFTNKSEDIIKIFLECLDVYNIDNRLIYNKRNNIYKIQIQKRKYVNILYQLLGEKYINDKKYNGINVI